MTLWRGALLIIFFVDIFENVLQIDVLKDTCPWNSQHTMNRWELTGKRWHCGGVRCLPPTGWCRHSWRMRTSARMSGKEDCSLKVLSFDVLYSLILLCRTVLANDAQDLRQEKKCETSAYSSDLSAYLIFRCSGIPWDLFLGMLAALGHIFCAQVLVGKWPLDLTPTYPIHCLFLCVGGERSC